MINRITLHYRFYEWIAEVGGKEYPLTANGKKIDFDAPVVVIGREIHKRYPQAEIWVGDNISSNPLVQRYIKNCRALATPPDLSDIQKMLDHPTTTDAH